MASILRAFGAAAAGLAVALASGTAARAGEAGDTVRVSVRSDGSEGEFFGSREPGISADGRYVVFSSGDELAANDTNALDDVYLHDTVTGETELISVTSEETSALGSSEQPVVSDDGRYVAFASDAPLTPDTEWNGGTFVRDRQAGVTTLIGPATYIFQGPDMSPDGRFVVFATLGRPAPADDNIAVDIYLWDREAPELRLVSAKPDGSSVCCGDSGEPAVSDNGQYVTYHTAATDLNGGVYGTRDVVTDLKTGSTTVVSDGDGAGAPVISGDGRFVAYSQNRAVKVWERATGETTVSAGDGVSLDPHLSRTGQYLAFWSSARDLVADPPSAPMSVYRLDRDTGQIVVAMTPPDDAFYGSERCDLSDDGRFVATETKSATLVPGDTNGQFDVFRTQVS